MTYVLEPAQIMLIHTVFVFGPSTGIVAPTIAKFKGLLGH